MMVAIKYGLQIFSQRKARLFAMNYTLLDSLDFLLFIIRIHRTHLKIQGIQGLL